MNYKIELTREELTTILQVATGNVKDFVMDNDKFINEQLEAINYTHSCKSDSEQLPSFLYKSDGGLYFKHLEDTDITDQWNNYLKTR